MSISRTRAAELGRETLRILEIGQYQNAAGETVAIGDLVQAAVKGTVAYPPDRALAAPKSSDRATQFEVRNESTLAAARRCVEAGERPVALNFASATPPGGGFLSGARAQEESLCRSSGLYACLAASEMYEFHRARHDPTYTDYALYSPGVPVFRDDEGNLLPRPWPCSFITCPAVNARAAVERDPSVRPEIREIMRPRVERVLSIAALHGHETLVLGAWGCGAFGNDPRMMAKLFHLALTRNFRGAFSRVIFAILDWSEELRFLGPFEAIFSSGPK
jgi:uncharacterized protein (TIGR02452 family)